MQLEGMFDVPEKKKATVAFHFDVPIETRPWRIGLIVGPSGAGKSSVARHLFGDRLREGYEWPAGRAVVDCLGDLPIKDIVGALSSVGFASPPGWLKPFQVLSNGERFRVNLARAILDPDPLVAIDEFTSVVDRQVARIGAHATAKAVRARPDKQLVAVTCHEDVLDWLQPDWVLEPHVGVFSWRSPQRRPTVDIEIVRCIPAAWRWFAPHHYLTGDLHKAARCFVGLVGGQLAAFTSLLPFPHPHFKRGRRLHRTVVLPDYQGLGLSMRLTEAVGAICRALDYRMIATAAHPTLIAARARSALWRMTSAPAIRGRHTDPSLRTTATTWRRRVASFEYVGPALKDAALARRLYA